jgi:hypothetical protein
MNVDKLKSTIAKRGGIARLNRFKVILTPPKQSLFNIDPEAIFTSLISGDGVNVKSLINDPRDISMLCTGAQIPGREFSTDEITMEKQTVKMPYGFIDPDVELKFMCTNDMYMKKMFDGWSRSVIDSETYTLGYKDDYTSDIIIQQLNMDNKVTYGAKLINAYPVAVGSIDYESGSEEVAEFTVSFAYDKYELEGGLSSTLSGVTEALGVLG